MFSGEATHTNFIVFGLTRLWLEPTIYHTRGEHANHYASNAVCVFDVQYSVLYSTHELLKLLYYKVMLNYAIELHLKF
jgi:hypothetical protein